MGRAEQFSESEEGGPPKEPDLNSGAQSPRQQGILRCWREIRRCELNCEDKGVDLKGTDHPRTLPLPLHSPLPRGCQGTGQRGQTVGGMGYLRSATQSFAFLDSLWRDPTRQHRQLLLSRVPQRLLRPHALRMAHLRHTWGEGKLSVSSSAKTAE